MKFDSMEMKFVFITLAQVIESSDKLIIVMLDGFRWDYYNMYKSNLPGFRQFLSEGVQVEYVEPVFPSQSLPAWTTIATGLFPESHNIIDNSILSRNVSGADKMFSYDSASASDPYWWEHSTEHLYTTATKQGKDVFLRRWSSCHVPFNGVSPKDCKPYSFSGDNLAEFLTEAIDKLSNGYSLAMIQYDQIDIVSHYNGPLSLEVKQDLIRLDGIIQTLLRMLKSKGLLDTINVVLTSDHGQTQVSGSNQFNFSRLIDYLNPGDVHHMTGGGAYVQIIAKPNMAEGIYERVKRMPGVDVYRRNDIPDKFHHRKAKFASDILIVAKPKVYITNLWSGDQEGLPNGKHGFWNHPDMRSIFFATGPAFRKGVLHKPIQMVDQYQVFTHVLKIKPCPHNGTWKNIAKMLKWRKRPIRINF